MNLPGTTRATLFSTLLRTRSVHGRELLAEMAWSGHSPDELLAWARDPGAKLEPEMDVDAVARFALVLGIQRGTAEEIAEALRIASALERSGVLDQFPARAAENLGQLRLLSGDTEGAFQLLGHPGVRPVVLDAARADAANPYLGGHAPDPDAERAWVPHLAHALRGTTAPIHLADGPGRRPFDRLHASAEPIDSPVRVSVLMSTYRPRASDLRVAVHAVLAQTWTNLELLVVDDASGPDADEVLAEIAALDPRVRVIRKAVNGGTYRARNTALRLMTGDFFTVVDSDDWVHPQFVEVAARYLLEHPSRAAVRTQGTRITEDLGLTRPGYANRYPSAASLMVRVHPTMARVGFFDAARKGADTEYALRIEAAFGQEVPTLPEVLTLNRSLPGSLSADEFASGWRHGTRHEYKSGYRAWHQRIATGAADPWLSPDEPRHFPQPLRWRGRRGAARERFDLVVAGDWRRFGGPQRSMLEEIRAALEGGLRVGVLHLEAMRFMTTEDAPLCRPLVDLLATGSVTMVHLDDDIEVDTLLVRYPPILQYPPWTPDPLRPRRVVIVANQAPLEPDGSDQRYCVEDVDARTTELFGVTPQWWPQGPSVRRLIREQYPDADLLPTDDVGLIDVDEWRCRGDAAPGADGRPVVIGRYSRDDPIKFPPSHAELMAAYDLGPGFEVRMMGARRALRVLADRAGVTRDRYPSQWTVLPAGAVDTKDFLSGLDFFVYLDDPGSHEAFGRVLLEAMSSGVLTIAHPKHRETFGDLLEYAEPADVPTVIARFRDPRAFRERVLRTLEGVRGHFGHERFLRALQESLSPPVGPPSVDPTPLLGPPEWLESVPPSDPDRVLAIPVRSAADGERADGVALLLAPDAVAAEVAAWLVTAVRDTASGSLDALLVSRAGSLGVREVVTHRQGNVTRHEVYAAAANR